MHRHGARQLRVVASGHGGRAVLRASRRRPQPAEIRRVGKGRVAAVDVPRTRGQRALDRVPTLESVDAIVACRRRCMGSPGRCVESRRSRDVHRRDRRIRIGPFARLGSTTRPPWVISTRPLATNRRAAMRAGSISTRQSSAATCRAASDGQIDASRERAASNWRIACSSSSSVAVARVRRHASEQYFT